MSTITVQTPGHVATPRGAQVAAWIFVKLAQGLKLAFQPVAAIPRGRRRAEAAAVRNYARQVQGQDPRFAADLYAAADRHDREE